MRKNGLTERGKVGLRRCTRELQAVGCKAISRLVPFMLFENAFPDATSFSKFKHFRKLLLECASDVNQPDIKHRLSVDMAYAHKFTDLVRDDLCMAHSLINFVLAFNSLCPVSE